MVIEKTNILNGKTYTMDIDVTEEQIAELNKNPRHRRPIQEIVPELSSEDREFLISGITPEEWHKIFS